jgi:tetratricopeptide (TPR) repeat protein
MAAGPVQAGIYNTAEPPIGPQPAHNTVQPLPFSQFRGLCSDLFNIQQPGAALGQRYLDQRKVLEAKVRAGSATTEDRVNLGAYLIRLRQYEEAVAVLTPAAAQERGNFMVFANLAAAHQLAGRLARALDYLLQVRDIWPRDWPGLSRDQLEWYRETESYHLKLVRLRAREEVRQPAGGRQPPPDTVDDLFGVRFVNDQGQYAAGQLAAAERQKLPRNALAIVQQLVLWLPDDTRLYWLLGELFNAQGDVAAAATVFEECVWSRRYDAPALKAHRQIVQESQAAAPPSLPVDAEDNPPAPSTFAWAPNARQLLLVGGAAGLIIIALVCLQIREIKKRRQGRAARDERSKSQA